LILSQPPNEKSAIKITDVDLVKMAESFLTWLGETMRGYWSDRQQRTYLLLRILMVLFFVGTTLYNVFSGFITMKTEPDCIQDVAHDWTEGITNWMQENPTALHTWLIFCGRKSLV